MRFVVETRERKSRPKLKEVLDIFRNRRKDSSNIPALKKQFRENMEKLYHNSNKDDKEEEKKDAKF